MIYVRAALDLIRSDVDVRGLAHITGGGLLNLLRLNEAAGFVIEDPLPVPPIIAFVMERGKIAEAEAWEIFNMGCGFVAVVPEAQADQATEILAAHHPGARRIGTVSDEAGARERRRRALLVRPGLALRIVLRRLVAARRHVRLGRESALGRGGAGHTLVAAHRLPVLFEV